MFKVGDKVLYPYLNINLTIPQYRKGVVIKVGKTFLPYSGSFKHWVETRPVEEGKFKRVFWASEIKSLDINEQYAAAF